MHNRSFPCDMRHYKSIKRQYDEAVEQGLEEFKCEMPDGTEWTVLVGYCKYLLEFMRNTLKITDDLEDLGVSATVEIPK